MAAVVALAFEAVGQACKNNGRVRSPRRFHRRGKLRFVRLVPVRRESLGVYNVRAVHTCASSALATALALMCDEPPP